MLYIFYVGALVYIVTFVSIIWLAFKHWRSKKPFIEIDPDD